MKRIRLLQHVFLTHILFFLMSASFFPFLGVSSLQNDSYQLVSSKGTVDYPPPAEPPPEPPLSVYPFWSADSYWHKKIKPNPTLHPNSAQMIDWLCNDPDGGSLGAGGNVYINWKHYTAPLWEADASTPRITIYKPDGSVRFNDVPWDPSWQVVPDDNDRSMEILDWPKRFLYDFWYFYKEGGKYYAKAGYKWDLDGKGYVTPPDNPYIGGSNTPRLAMVIRDEEIEAGVINHPLGCCMHHVRKESMGFVYPPASRSDGKGDDPYSIPMGARIQLDPSVNINAYGLNPTAKIIAKALQDYGVVVKESGGGWFLYAEHDLSVDWDSNMANGILANLPNDKWRVIDYTQGAEVNLELPSPPTSLSSGYSFESVQLGKWYTSVGSATATLSGEKWPSGLDRLVKFTVDHDEVDGALTDVPAYVRVCGSAPRQYDTYAGARAQLQKRLNQPYSQ